MHTRVSWRGVVVGALAVLVINTATVFFVFPLFEGFIRYFDPIVVVGLLSLLVSVLRAAAGIFAARRHRRDFRVDSASEYLATAALAGALGWVCWVLLLGALGDWSGLGSGRMWLELPRWMAELAVGSLLVRPEPPEEEPLRFRQRVRAHR